MEVKLIVVGGKNAGTSLPLSGPKFFIGRAEDCNLRPHSDLVSRHHCAILLQAGLVAVRDFGSKNGTYVNGERIRAEQTLKSGDVLKVGDLELQIQVDVPIGGKNKSKVHSVQEAAARTAEPARREGLASKDEFDIDELMGEETRRVVAETETKVLTLSPPEVVAPLPHTPSAAKTATPEPFEQQTTQERKKEEQKKKEAEMRAGWNMKKKPGAGSSREAAGEMLKQFFRSHRE